MTGDFMAKRVSTIFLTGLFIVTLLLGGCQSFPGSKKKKDNYGKDFEQRVAEDPFPRAGTPIRQ